MNTSARTIFLTAKRTNLSVTEYSAEWGSPLSFWLLQFPFDLRIDDETGPDWPGADEFELTVFADSELLLQDVFDDADSGEFWPDLPRRIRDRVRLRTGSDQAVAFTESITVSLLKLDGVAAHGSMGTIFPALTTTSPDRVNERKSFLIVDPLGDGQATFYCTLSRIPPNTK